MSKQAEAVKKWRIKSKERMISAMGGECVCCGYDKCSQSLGFHHLDPAEKDMSFGAIRANPKSWAKIVEELRKCVLVCGNCHMEIHYGMREIPEKVTRFDENWVRY